MSKIVKLILVIVAIVLVVIGLKSGVETGQKILNTVEYQDLIERYADENGLDKYLVMAVIKVESNYQPQAASAYAKGLMQITDETAQWISEHMELTEFDLSHLTDPETSIKMGCWYLKYLIDFYDNNTDTALAAYNGGMGNVAGWLQNPEYSDDGANLKYIPYTETREYVVKVNNKWQYYRENY